MVYRGMGLAKTAVAGRARSLGEGDLDHPIFFSGEMSMTYQKPVVQRFGSLRELTLGGGAQLAGDATNLYHRS